MRRHALISIIFTLALAYSVHAAELLTTGPHIVDTSGQSYPYTNTQIEYGRGVSYGYYFNSLCGTQTNRTFTLPANWRVQEWKVADVASGNTCRIYSANSTAVVFGCTVDAGSCLITPAPEKNSMQVVARLNAKRLIDPLPECVVTNTMNVKAGTEFCVSNTGYRCDSKVLPHTCNRVTDTFFTCQPVVQPVSQLIGPSASCLLPPVIHSFVVTQSVVQPGEDVVLSWNVAGATDVYIQQAATGAISNGLVTTTSYFDIHHSSSPSGSVSISTDLSRIVTNYTYFRLRAVSRQGAFVVDTNSTSKRVGIASCGNNVCDPNEASRSNYVDLNWCPTDCSQTLPVSAGDCRTVLCQAGEQCKQTIPFIGPYECVATACTSDAKLCPDGSYVDRDASNSCQFRSCPPADCRTSSCPSDQSCLLVNGAYQCIARIDPRTATLAITSPTPAASIEGATIGVRYVFSGGGDVDHVHLQLDANPEVRDTDADGSYVFGNVPAGTHTLRGYLARADHSKIDGTDTAVTVSTHISATPGPGPPPPSENFVSAFLNAIRNFLQNIFRR